MAETLTKSPVKERGHRPAFDPTDKQRKEVEAYAGVGVAQDQIASIIGISAPTLRKYFAEELERGAAKATASIAKRLYDKAMAGDTPSLIFWMKVRAGWREKPDLPPNEPIVVKGGLPDA